MVFLVTYPGMAIVEHCLRTKHSEWWANPRWCFKCYVSSISTLSPAHSSHSLRHSSIRGARLTRTIVMLPVDVQQVAWQQPVSLTFRHAFIPTCSAASFHRRVCRPKWNDGKIGPWSKRTLSSKMISQIPRARPHLERGKVSQTQRERSSQGCDFCRRKGGVWDKRAWLCWKKEACLLFPWCTYFPICTRPWDLWLPPPWAKELETLFYTIGLCPLSSTHEGSPNSHYEVSHKYPKLINHRVHTKGLLQTHAGFGIVTSVSVSPSELCLFD